MDDTATTQSNSYVNTYVPPSDAGAPVSPAPTTEMAAKDSTAVPAVTASPLTSPTPNQPWSQSPSPATTDSKMTSSASAPVATNNGFPPIAPIQLANTGSMGSSPTPPPMSSPMPTPAAPTPTPTPSAPTPTATMPPLPTSASPSVSPVPPPPRPATLPEEDLPMSKVEVANPPQPSAPASDVKTAPEPGQSQTLEDQNIFDLLGVSQASDEEKEAFLDELQQVIWEDFLENDVELLLTEAEVVELKKIQAQTFNDDLEKQEAIVVYLEKLIPDLEEIMLEKALELKRDMFMERIAGMKEYYADKPERLPEVTKAETLVKDNQWRAAAEALNQSAAQA